MAYDPIDTISVYGTKGRLAAETHLIIRDCDPCRCTQYTRFQVARIATEMALEGRYDLARDLGAALEVHPSQERFDGCEIGLPCYLATPLEVPGDPTLARLCDTAMDTLPEVWEYATDFPPVILEEPTPEGTTMILDSFGIKHGWFAQRHFDLMVEGYHPADQILFEWLLEPIGEPAELVDTACREMLCQYEENVSQIIPVLRRRRKPTIMMKVIHWYREQIREALFNKCIRWLATLSVDRRRSAKVRQIIWDLPVVGDLKRELWSVWRASVAS